MHMCSRCLWDMPGPENKPSDAQVTLPTPSHILCAGFDLRTQWDSPASVLLQSPDVPLCLLLWAEMVREVPGAVSWDPTFGRLQCRQEAPVTMHWTRTFLL